MNKYDFFFFKEKKQGVCLSSLLLIMETKKQLLTRQYFWDKLLIPLSNNTVNICTNALLQKLHFY